MLFNPDYLGLDSFAGFAPVPGVDLSVQLLQSTLTLHTVWSICVPIAITEAFSRDRTAPWLGRVGIAVTAVVFVLGSAVLTVIQADYFDFVAPPALLIGSGAVIAALVVLAVALGRRPVHLVDAPVPAPWVVGCVAFAVAGVFWGESVFFPELLSEWLTVIWWFVPVTVIVLLARHWSTRRGWHGSHVLALAGGALLTYVWAGFANGRDLDVSSSVALLGNVVFGACALVVLAAAVRATRARALHPGVRVSGRG